MRESIKMLLLSVIFIAVNACGWPAAYHNWKYVATVPIAKSDTGILHDYTHKLTLTDATFDFRCATPGSIRFTTKSGSDSIPYYVASWDSARGVATIYLRTSDTAKMLWGNRRATSTSDGFTTFKIFDDFESWDGTRSVGEWTPIYNGLAYGCNEVDSMRTIWTFDLDTFRLHTYYSTRFHYGTAVLLLPKANGDTLLILREVDSCVVRGLDLRSGAHVWRYHMDTMSWSADLSYYHRLDDGYTIICSGYSGVYGIDAENGTLRWKNTKTTLSKSPGVDQVSRAIYFQTCNSLVKLDAETGTEIHVSTTVPGRYCPDGRNDCQTGNTVIARYQSSTYIACCYFGGDAAGGERVYVYDTSLAVVWADSAAALDLGKRSWLAYANGILVRGSGNIWRTSPEYLDPTLRYVKGYNIQNGTETWKTSLSNWEYGSIQGCEIVTGRVLATTDYAYHRVDHNRMLFVLDLVTGSLIDSLNFGHYGGTCANPSFSNGMLIAPNSYEKNYGADIIRLGTGSKTNWVGAWCDQANTMCAPSGALNIFDAHPTLVNTSRGRPRWNPQTWFYQSDVHRSGSKGLGKRQPVLSNIWTPDTITGNCEVHAMYRPTNGTYTRGGLVPYQSLSDFNNYKSYYLNLTGASPYIKIQSKNSSTTYDLVSKSVPQVSGTHWFSLTSRSVGNATIGIVMDSSGNLVDSMYFNSLIINGDFTSFVDDTTPTGWTNYYSQTTLDNGAARVYSTNSGYKGPWQEFAITSGSVYHIKAKCRTTSGETGRIRVDAITAGSYLLPFTNTSDAWREGDFTATGSGTCRVWLQIITGGTGHYAWFDSVSVTQISEQGTLTNNVGIVGLDTSCVWDDFFVRKFTPSEPTLSLESKDSSLSIWTLSKSAALKSDTVTVLGNGFGSGVAAQIYGVTSSICAGGSDTMLRVVVPKTSRSSPKLLRISNSAGLADSVAFTIRASTQPRSFGLGLGL